MNSLFPLAVLEGLRRRGGGGVLLGPPADQRRMGMGNVCRRLQVVLVRAKQLNWHGSVRIYIVKRLITNWLLDISCFSELTLSNLTHVDVGLPPRMIDILTLVICCVGTRRSSNIG